MIQFVNVSKSYDSKNAELVALDNVTFEIDDGEFVFLIGPSGSGKTTLIRLLIREELPTEGTIFFDNEDITKFSRQQIYYLRRKIGVIFQDYKLIDDKTIYENVAFVMEAAGKSEKEIKETVPYLIDIVGLADRMESFPPELSGGEKQRVAIARALANNPKVLIADEPTGNLDPEAAWDIVQILKKINDWGTTVIMSTHGSEIVDKVGKRVIKIENGVLARDEKEGSYKTNNEKHKEDFETKILEEHKDEKVEESSEPTKEEAKEEKKEDITVEIKKDESTPVNEEPKEAAEPVAEIKEEIKEPEKKEETKTPEEKPKDEEVVEETKAPEPKTKAKNHKFKISLVHKKGKNERDEESHKSEIAALVLPPKIIKILEENGYNEITKIVDAGVEKISKIKDLKKEDVEIIRKSIINYIQNTP